MKEGVYTKADYDKQVKTNVETQAVIDRWWGLHHQPNYRTSDRWSVWWKMRPTSSASPKAPRRNPRPLRPSRIGKTQPVGQPVVAVSG